MAYGTLRYIPLGGLGEVGKNMNVLEYGDDIIIIDAGIGFPQEDMLGIDLLLPDISYLVERQDKIRAIFITHGHEDHIGGLPYLLPEIKAPIFATRLTRGLIEVKLKERGLLADAELHTVQPRERVEVGCFGVEFFHVCHSIPDGVGLAIDTPVGTVVHTGDFKFDQSPVDGNPTDFARLAEAGERGVLALLSDCVHVEASGVTPSELVISDTFDRVFREARGRVIVATFGSLISRVQQVIDTASRCGRKVAVVGRSLEQNVPMARELGYLSDPEGTLLRWGEIRHLPPEQVVYVVTGSQGEPMAVLSLIANEDHRFIKIDPGDTVIISATPIPGNETSVGRVINKLFQLGANVIYSAIAQVHVSGHASQEELKLMLNLVRPRYVVPIHGERRHLTLYSKLAQQVGVPADNIFITSNGDVVEFDEQGARIAEQISSGSVYVDGLSVGGVGHAVVRDRQLLARDGILMVVVAIDRQTGRLVGGPDIVSRGFVYMKEADEIIDTTIERVRDAFERNGSVPPDWGFINRKIKDIVVNSLYQQTRRRPLVMPVVLEI